jgi:hypothetical protein
MMYSVKNNDFQLISGNEMDYNKIYKKKSNKLSRRNWNNTQLYDDIRKVKKDVVVDYYDPDDYDTIFDL